MSIYKSYIELTPLDSKLLDKMADRPFKVVDMYRRSVSVAVNTLHQIAKKKSIGGYAIAVIESDFYDVSLGLVKVQSKIRVFTKKNNALEHFKSVLSAVRFFQDFYAISDLKTVPEDVLNYNAYVRVRLPTIKKQPASALLKREHLEQSTDCNFIFLMPSSSKIGNKKLIRYYYRIVPTDRIKPAQFSKPDGYGFSRTNRICAIATF